MHHPLRDSAPVEQGPLVLDVQDGVPAVRDVEGAGLQLGRHHVRDFEADLQGKGCFSQTWPT